MAWRSSLWTRWLGWTAFYALVLVGAGVVTVRLALYINPSDADYPVWLTTLAYVLSVLVPAVLAFGIGVRFRSWWWGLGPLVVFGPLGAVFAITAWTGLVDSRGWGLVAGVGAVTIGGLLAPFALAGVWLGKRRHACER
jgi:hypothetical protein